MRRANASKGRPKIGERQAKVKTETSQSLRLPRNAPEIDLTIRFVGSRGDGIAQQVTQSGMRLKTGRFTCQQS